MEETKTTKKSSSYSWREALSGLGSSFVKNFAGSMIEKIRNRIEETVVTLKKGIIGIFLVAIGLVFSLIGMVAFLNDLLQLGDGVGYLLVGVFSILVGYIIIKK